jgi:predicted nucleic acid-binding Zn ribbon protein
MKCKNCGTEIKKNRVYCSLKCRNIYVNKNLRDYSKLKKINKEKRKTKLEEYHNNPKKCKNCGKIIPFEKKLNAFCNNSCSASFNNKNINNKNISEEGYNNIKKANRRIAKERWYNEKIEYYSNKKRCKKCNKIIPYDKRQNVFCDNKCKKEYFLIEKDNYYLYKRLTKFNFNLKDFKDEFNFNLIEKYGWYKAKNNGNNMDGVSRDHMFSVKEGFRQMVNPLILAHPSNCKLIKNRKNQSKSDNCSITIEKLLDNIKNFDNKYGKYYDFEIKTHINFEELKELYKVSYFSWF